MELVTRATKGRPVEHKPRTEEIPATYPKGRICSAAKVCKGKTLSVYNGGPNCHACDEAIAGPSMLTKTQRQIVELARRGYSNQEIAEVIDTTPNAIGTRISELRAIGVDLPFAADREELRRLMESRAA
jgi:biotin operon repressor